MNTTKDSKSIKLVNWDRELGDFFDHDFQGEMISANGCPACDHEQSIELNVQSDTVGVRR